MPKIIVVTGDGPYCAAKDAVALPTESMAQELRASGIKVNPVAPSIAGTPASRAAMPDADPANRDALADSAAAIEFLASPRARSRRDFAGGRAELVASFNH